MKYYTFLIFICVSIASVFSQKTDALRLTINPFVQRIGNLNNQYISTSNEFIDVKYSAKPSFEIGIDYMKPLNHKFNVSFGTSWMYSKYLTTADLKHPYASNNFSVGNFERESKVHSFSLRTTFSYSIIDRLCINAHISAYIPFQEKNSSTITTHFSIVSSNLFFYDIRTTERGYVGSADIVPELSANFRVYKNLNLTTGIRCKFWQGSNNEHYKIDITGWTNSDNFGNKQQLHLSKENSRVFSYYFGLLYDLPFNKKVEK